MLMLMLMFEIEIEEIGKVKTSSPLGVLRVPVHAALPETGELARGRELRLYARPFPVPFPCR